MQSRRTVKTNSAVSPLLPSSVGFSLRSLRTHSVGSSLLLAMLTLLLTAGAAHGQTTTFSYQGRLNDGGTPANGNYDLQFTLWDALSGGTQQPQPMPVTVTLASVAVSAGIFTVQLDFGASTLPGADRFLEISARPSGGGSFTLLSPRQQITSAPYAIRSLNASSADAIPVGAVPAGSGNYIQNTSNLQMNSNFNISGNGAAGTLSGNIVNATTQYNIGGNRILRTYLDSTFLGLDAGTANTRGGNSFFGSGTGILNTTGGNNTFLGVSAGGHNTSDGNNTFVGFRAGLYPSSGAENTLIGANTDHAAGITNATAIGARASVTQSSSLVLGSINGVNFGYSDTNVGIGTPAPGAPLEVQRDGNITASWQNAQVRISGRTDPRMQLNLGYDSTNNVGVVQPGQAGVAFTNLSLNPSGGNVGIGTSAPKARLHVQGGDAYIFDAGKGVILKSPNGLVCMKLTIDNTGTAVLAAISCP